MKNTICLSLLIVTALLIPDLSWGQVTLSGVSYTQDFDAVGGGLPTGWTGRTGATASTLGTVQTFNTTATAWSITTGQFRNTAASESPATSGDNAATQSGRADRVMAVRQTSSFGDPGAAFVLQISNTTGFTDFDLSFKLQSLDPGTAARTATWIVDYGFGASPTSFTSVTTSPATLTTKVGTWASTNVTVDFGSALDNNAGPVWIRIVTLLGTTGSGNRPLSGIDDFTLTWSAGTPSLSPGTLSAFGNVCINTTAGPNSFSLSGSNLDNSDITVGPLSGFTFATSSGGTYSSTVTLTTSGVDYTYGSGSLSGCNIFVKFNPVAVQSYGGTGSSGIPISGGGVGSTIYVDCTGSGVNTPGSVTTTTATGITQSGASSGGNATAGCSAITARGVVFGTSPAPTGNATSDGSGAGSYTSTISGMSSGTLVYYRAYIDDGTGRVYGNELSFTTLKAEPTNQPTTFACGTTTSTEIPLTWTDASGGTSPDGYLVKWSNTSYAAISDPADGTPESNGAGVQNVAQGQGNYTFTGLTPGTTYYFKIWSYTNSGSNIDYKLALPPQTSCATLSGPCHTEDFSGIGNSSTYGTRTWNGVGGSWTATDAREDQTINGKAITVRNGVLTSPTFNDGVGSITVTVKFPFSESSGNLTLKVNGSTVGTILFADMNGSTPVIKTFSGINVGGNVQITATSTVARYTIDDLNWTCYTACTPPSSQASSVTVSNPTSSGFDAGFTRGTDDGTILVARQTSASNTLPVQTTSYTANINWASAGQIDVDNRVVAKSTAAASSVVSVTGITGLNAETQYTITAYEYINATNCYNQTSPPSNTQWTLSTEPSSHAASFSGTSPAYNQVDLSFSAANTISNADGYIILQKQGSVPTGTPADATGYTVGNTIGDATVAAIVTSASATSQSVTGLNGSTNYYFTLIPFNWNGTNAPTYNYRTAATIPSTNVTTLVQPSGASDIIFNSGSPASQNQNIDYTVYQSAVIANTGSGSGGSIGVMSFIVRDGGAAANDADNLPTILTGITFSATNVANIRSAAIFQGSQFVKTIPVNGTSPFTFTFSGAEQAYTTASDNGTVTLNLRVTFNTSVTDNQKMVFTITNATAASGSTSSLFAAGDAGGAQSENTGGDINRIEVTADRLGFVSQPTQTPVNTAMAAVTVEGKDVYGNRDLDYTGSIDITSTGALSGSPVSATASSGLATWSTGGGNALVHSAQATGRQLTATTTGLLYSNTATSNLFNIDNTPGNSYRTTSAGTWTSSGGTATWERLISGVWTANAAPPFNVTNNVYIRHAISITGSASPANVIIQNGGTLTNTSSCTYGTSLLVQSGGTLQVNGSLTVSGTFEVEDNGNVNINFEFGNPVTSIWSGTENFHPNSNLVLQDWDGANDILIPDNTSISTNTYNSYTAAFGNIIFDFADRLGSSDDLIMLASGITINMAHGNLVFRTNDAANSADMRVATTGIVTSGIGGDFIVEDTYIGAVYINFKTSGTLDFTIKGNMQLDAATTRIMAGSISGSSSTVTVEGDITITSSAVLEFNSTIAGGSPPPAAILNLKGDLTVTSGGLLRNSNTSNNGTFNFSGTGDGSSAALTQSIDISSTGATRNQYINFNTLSGAYVQLKNQNFELGKNSCDSVKAGGTFDFGFNGSTALNVTGYSTGESFRSDPASTLKITSPDGITTTAGVGNVQVTASNRSYNKPAIFWYIGKQNQMMGNAITTGGNTNNHIIAELADNSITLTPSNNIGISNTASVFDALGGKLNIRKGIVIETASATITGSGRLVMTDGTFRTSVTGVTLPQLTNYTNYSLTGGTVELNGSGNQTLRGSLPNYYNVKISGTNTLGTDAKKVSSSVTINNNLEVTDNAVFDSENYGIVGNAGLTMNSNGRWRISKISNTTLPELLGISTPYSLTGGTVELYGSTSGGGSIPQLIRGTANGNNITYYKIEINASAANTTNGNVGSQASFSVSNSLIVNSPAIFNIGNTDYVEGAGSFTVSDNAGLYYGNVNGIKTGTGAVRATGGNILVTGGRNYGLGTYGFVGTNAAMVSGNGLPATVKNLYMLKVTASDVVNLTNDVTVNNNLVLTSGILTPNTNNKTVIVADGGSVSRTNGHVHGNLQKTIATGVSTVQYEIGDAANYTPLSLSFSANSNSGTVTVRTVGADHAQINNPSAPLAHLSRYWVFSNTLTNYTYTGTLSYVAGDINGTESFIKLSRWSGGAWNEYKNESAAAANVLSISSSLDQSTAPLSGDYTGRVQCTTPTVSAKVNGTATPSPVCSQTSNVFTANPAGPGLGCTGDYVYAWTNGAKYYNGTDFGSNTPVYDISYSSITSNVVTAVTSDYTFTVLVKCSDANCSSSSDVTLNVKELPNVTVNPPASVCSGQTSVTLNASGAVSYSWSPTTYLTPSSGTSATETAQISQLTFYTVTGTGANGCSNDIVVPVATVSVGGNVDNTYSIICTGNSKLLTVTGAAGNAYQWQSSSDGLTGWSYISGATNTSYTAAPSSKTYYRLIAKSNACWDVASTTAVVDISNPAITVTVTEKTDNSLSLNWSPVGSGNYTISYDGTTSGSVSGKTPPYTLSGLTANGTYNITVTQTGIVGCSASGTLTGINTLCAMPDNVVASSPGSKKLKVDWEGAAGDYRVYYRPTFVQNGYQTKDVTTAGTSGSTTINVTYNTSYEVYMVSKDCPSSGQFGQPSALHYTIVGPSSPCTPAPTINYVKSTCAGQIEVSMSNSPTGNYMVAVQRLTPTVTSMNLYSVTGNYFQVNVGSAGQTFLVAVASKCLTGTSDYVVYAGGITIKPLCNAVPNLVLSNPTCHGFTASWNRDVCAENTVNTYQVFLRRTSPNPQLTWNSYVVASPSPPITPYKLVKWMNKGSVIQCYVRSNYVCNGYVIQGPPSTTESITTLSAGCREEDESLIQPEEPAAVITSADNTEAISLYPNPNGGQFRIDISRLSNEKAEVRIEVMNILGQTILTRISEAKDGFGNELITLPETVSSGTYFVRVTVGDNIYSAKVSVSR